jgi:hypothetical protein
VQHARCRLSLIDSRRIRKERERRRGGVLPEVTDLVEDGSFEKDGSGWYTVVTVTGGTRLGALRSSWERLQGHAKVNTTDGYYEGLLVEPATTGAVGRQLQSALTKEVELAKLGELVAELVKLHQHDWRRESGVAPGGLPELGLGMGHGVAYANVQDEQQSAGCACYMVHWDAGGAPSANDRLEAPEGRSG